MRARKYNKRVEFYQNIEQKDDFAGATFPVTQFIGKSWAQIKTVENNSRLAGLVSSVGLGEISPEKVLVIRVRKRKDLPYNPINQFFKYAGRDYVIQNVNEVDFNNEDIEIIGIAEKIKSTPIINVGENGDFPYVFPLILE